MLSIFKSRPVGHLQAVTLAQEQLDSLNHDPSLELSDLERLLTQIKEQLLEESYYNLPNAQKLELEKKLNDEEFLNDLILNQYKLNSNCKRLSFKILQYCLTVNAKAGKEPPFVNYLNNRPKLIVHLFNSYESKDPTQNIELIKLVFRYPSCFEQVLKAGSNEKIEFFKFFQYIQFSSLDLSCHCFQLFKDCIKKHSKIMSRFIFNHFQLFFDNYYELILNSNYVIKRQSLKLLGEFLLDRINFKIMTLLMNEVNYLKLIMNCLKDSSKNIQWEAFHIFKIFVANPNKPENITKILRLNQLKLIEFLNSFFENKSEDEKFIDERDYIILQIQNL